MIQQILQNYKNILIFLFFILLFNLIFGSKATKYLLWLIILGMVLLNSDEIMKLINLIKI